MRANQPADRGDFIHIPVLMATVLELARACTPRWFVDCTVGGAGHAQALLEAFPQARLLGLDRDPEAVAVARARLARFGQRAEVVQSAFSQLPVVLAGRRPDFILADFGVSSYQLETPARGFSFNADGELDMRMDPQEGQPVWQLLEHMNAADIARVLWTLGEERYSRRIARALVGHVPRTTRELADRVRRLVPKSADGIDPATRTFQALRMHVNRELAEIEAWLQAVPNVLADDGVCVAISFHSLEDRAVKQGFRQEARGCLCPPALPVCGCGHVPTLHVLTSKPRVADLDEVARNPRARSARLRAARRLPRKGDT